MPNYVSSPFRQIAFSYVWDVGTLRWIPGQQATGGGGGGGDASAANQTIEITKLTSIDGKTPALVTGRVPVDGSGVTQPVSGTFWQATQPVSGTVTANQGGTWNVTNISGTVSLPTGASTESTLGTRLSESDFDTKTGSLTETAPATDTASSGLNGRLQRVAQCITSLIALLPAALVGGRFDTNTGSWLGSTAPTVGSKTSANSVPVVVASDQAAIPVTQSGSWSLSANQSVNMAQLNGAAPSVTNPLMVQLSDGVSAVNVTNYQQTLAMLAAQQLRVLQSQPANGFIPIEIPPFLGA